MRSPGACERLGATLHEDGSVSFVVWAPAAGAVEVVFGDGESGAIPLAGPDEFGYHRGGSGSAGNVGAGTRYRYRLDGDPGRTFADPASAWQPDGVHGPSAVLDPGRFPWTDRAWRGLALRDYVLYELHVGTFSPEGTFDGVVRHLDGLRELGVTVVEPMPIGQFPGTRNWGYDGVFPFAAQDSYGGPEAFARLVDACHARGMAVCLDVVYNHVGPEGAVHREFGPYVTDRYRTAWGDALNVDGPGADGVRRYFIENAVRWFEDFHVDALRLDAVHGIVDVSASTFLEELELAKEDLAAGLGRRLHLIAESDLGGPRFVERRGRGGLGLDAQWYDDLHHALHSLLTGERGGYYEDFGSLEHLARGYRDGSVYQGQYSRHRRRRHGAPTTGIPAERFVVFAQNHDQAGNRMLGERLTALVDFESLKLAAAAILLSPFLPLLFMGEEYAEPAPFQYFVSHSDLNLVASVREGRVNDFAAFGFTEVAPDPDAEATFLRCRLDHVLETEGRHRRLRELYRELLRLRRSVPALASLRKDRTRVRVDEERQALHVWRGDDASQAVMTLWFDGDPPRAPVTGDGWRLALHSADEEWGGPGRDAPGARGARVMVREGHDA